MGHQKHTFLRVALLALVVCSLLTVASFARSDNSEIDYFGRDGIATLENGENYVKLYDIINNAVASYSLEVEVDPKECSVHKDDIKLVLEAYRNDHPEVFYFEGSIGISYSPSTNEIRKITFNYIFDVEDIPARVEEFEAAAKWMLRDIPADASDYEISLILHDRIAQRVEYELDGTYAHNAYGVIVDDDAVCEGYARAYQYLLHKMGINSTVVTGWSRGVGHAWNLVEIDDKYYYTDVTWDDQVNMIYYSYFNTTSEVMEYEHDYAVLPYELPVATATDANYFEVNDSFTDKNGPSLEDAARLYKKDGYIRVYVRGDSPSEIISWFSNNVLEIGDSAYSKYGLKNASYRYMGAREFVFLMNFTEKNTDSEFNINVIGGEAFGADDSENPIVKSMAGLCVVLEAVDAPDGMIFDHWVVVKGNANIVDPYGDETIFFMPTEDVEIKAVYVNDRAQIASQPVDVSVTNGEEAVFSISADGKNLTYQWYITGGSYGDSAVAVGTNSPMFTYSAKDSMCLDNGAEIYCVVNSDIGGPVKSDTVTLTVNHNPQSNVILPAEEGHFYMCVCGQPANLEAHFPGDEATCTETQVCTLCNYVLAPAKGHTPGAEATCTDAQTCTECSAELTPAKGHTPGAEATCTQAQACTECGFIINTAKGHTPGAPATCVEHQFCTVCNDVIAVATGHTPDPANPTKCIICGGDATETKHHVPGEEATCTEPQLCTVCGDIVVPAKGHTPDVNTSCTVDKFCAECGDKLSSAKPHTPGAEATCTEAQTCIDCGYELTPAKGHTPGAEATCTEAQTCTECSAELTPAKGHSFDKQFTIDSEATYEKPGEKSRHCADCDERCDITDIPQLKDTSLDFEDVTPDAWFKPYVDFAVSNGLMSGMGGGVFAPNTTMNRAMLVTVLYRIEGSPEVSGEHPFTDLEQDWYKAPVAWAYQNKIVSGTSDTTYSPNAPITREQLATILYRYTQSKGYDTSARAELTAFPDGDKTNSWAVEALSWANAAGLITGSKSGDELLLDPQGSATRAQVATILQRFINSL